MRKNSAAIDIGTGKKINCKRNKFSFMHDSNNTGDDSNDDDTAQ